MMWAVLIPVILIFGSDPSSAQTAAKTHKTIKGLDDVYILKSEDRKHAILRAACKSCHPDTDFDFWMLVYGDEEPRLEAEVEKGVFGGASAGHSAIPGYSKAGRKGEWDYPNSHDYFDCEFCHLGTPKQDSEEKPSFAMPLKDLCAPCHPEKEMLHLYGPGTSAGKVKLEALLKHNLPTQGGEVLCLTCHQMHNAVYSVRPGYIKAEITERSVNPHGAKLYCLLCHEGKLDNPIEVTIRKAGDSVALCTECHSGQQMGRDHHPVEVAIGEDTWKAGFIEFPFSAGRMSCTTCHDEVCYLPRDPSNKAFLRGGPYSEEREFCFRCHVENVLNTLNPHDQFHSVGLLKIDTCYVCHASVTGSEGNAEVGELVDDAVFLCQKCHGGETPHPAVNHILKMPKSMVEMKLDYEEKHKIVLPLTEDGGIICTTCHNPHDKGVLKGELAAGAGEMDFLRLPDYVENCAPCHGDQR